MLPGNRPAEAPLDPLLEVIASLCSFIDPDPVPGGIVFQFLPVQRRCRIGPVVPFRTDDAGPAQSCLERKDKQNRKQNGPECCSRGYIT